MTTNANSLKLLWAIRLGAATVLMFLAARCLAEGATWTGNVPSIQKAGDAWTVSSVIPDLVAFRVTDSRGKDVCVKRHYMVGTREGAIDEKAVKFEVYTFDTTQTLAVGGESCTAKEFVFAFHGDESLYSSIKELAIAPALSDEMGWCATGANGDALPLAKVRTISKDECAAVYKGGTSISYRDFRDRFLKDANGNKPKPKKEDVAPNESKTAPQSIPGGFFGDLGVR